MVPAAKEPHGNPHRAFLEKQFHRGAAPFPLARRLGLKVVELGPGQCLLELPVGPALHNPMAVIHGGVIMGLLDTAMGFASTMVLEGATTTSTIDVKVNFIRAVRAGRLRAEGRVIRRGRTLVHLEARAWNAAGEIVAQGLGTAMIVPTGSLSEVGRRRRAT